MAGGLGAAVQGSTAVAQRSGISRATLYRHPEPIDVIRDHHARGVNADTLTELSTRVAQLHTIIEALAARVRQQEERLRQLEVPRRTATRA